MLSSFVHGALSVPFIPTALTAVDSGNDGSEDGVCAILVVTWTNNSFRSDFPPPSCYASAELRTLSLQRYVMISHRKLSKQKHHDGVPYA